MSGKNSILSIWTHHISAGIAFGSILGLLHFIIEPMLVCRDSHAYFGVSLSRVLLVYLLFGCVLGVIVGFFSGLLDRVTRRRLSILHPIPAVGSIVGFILTFLFIMRNLSLGHLKSFHANAAGYTIAALMLWLGMGWFLSRFCKRKGEWGGDRVTRRKPQAVLSVLCLAGIALIALWIHLTSFRLPDREPLIEDAPNIVLIVSDALRPDHLSAYGYERDTSPQLSRLADEGILFSRAYAHGNRTYYTMPPLFTSLYHADHGYLWTPDMMYPLPEERVTLAEMLQEAGYSTVGLITNAMLKSELQMTQGFDRVDEFNIEHSKLSVYRTLKFLGIIEGHIKIPEAKRVTDKTLQWLDRLDSNPFFLLVYYMDTHHAYTPPERYEEMFRSSTNTIDANDLFKVTKDFLLNPEEEPLSGDEIERLIDLYDACIRYVDEEIGKIIEAVQADHADRETIVIFTADHGDEFLERGLVYHNNLLIEELIRVPLIIWRSQKKYENHEIDCLVRHIDLLPTVADWAGIEPPQGARGVSLVPLIDGIEEEFDLELIAEGAESTCLIHQNWKILHVDSTDSYYLYDLSVDSYGHTDVSQKYPKQLTHLKTRLKEYLDRARESAAEGRKPMSPEMIKQLKALGYL
jgi:arylsulfatase A-like enzyme